MAELAYRSALITGAGSGVGRAVAASLAGLGLDVALLGRDVAKLQETAGLLPKGSGKVLIHGCDVADRGQVEEAVSAVVSAFGGLDVLVSNAGINVPKRSLEQLDPADWDRMLATNLTGAFNLAHFALPAMRKQGRGLVVQIASISGLRAGPLGGVGYCASKFGQAALGICLGREERKHGIRSSVIYPGEINTPILDKRPVPVPPERKAQILQPEDVAAAVRFLVELPPHVNVPELVLTPTVDDWA